MKHWTLALTVTILLTYADRGGAQHYFSAGQQIPLRIDQHKVKIKFVDGLTDSDRQEMTARIGAIDSWLLDEYPTDGFYAYALAPGQTFGQVVSALRTVEGIEMVEPFYVNEFGRSFNTGSRFVVGLHQWVPSERMEAINLLHHVEIDHVSESAKSVYVLRITAGSDFGLIDMANAYYELEETYFAHPDFTGSADLTSYQLEDNYHGYQWHIKRVIGQFNEASVWDFAGLTDTLIVAVIDDGLANHYDLDEDRILPGYDFAYNDPNPSPGPLCSHGMACAGLIAANHSIVDEGKSSPVESGMISINPNVKILPVKIVLNNCTGIVLSQSRLADAINYAWQQGADVLSNSWGVDMPAEVVISAIDSAVTRGRNGKGSAVVFSSGNSTTQIPGMLMYAGWPTTLAVGASGISDMRLPYSMYSWGLDLLAPSGNACYQGDVWSLDQESNYGMNPNVTYIAGCPAITWDCPPPAGGESDFNCHFGGTSAAAAIVSGVASLVLARDPDMPVDSDASDYSLYGILRGSAVRVSGSVPDLESGYGRVDAYRAVLSIARGDVNNDDDVSIGDVSLLIDHEMITGSPIWPDSLLGDVNCDGDVSIGDISLLIDHIFISGAPLPLPCFEFND